MRHFNLLAAFALLAIGALATSCDDTTENVQVEAVLASLSTTQTGTVTFDLQDIYSMSDDELAAFVKSNASFKAYYQDGSSKDLSDYELKITKVAPTGISYSITAEGKTIEGTIANKDAELYQKFIGTWVGKANINGQEIEAAVFYMNENGQGIMSELQVEDNETAAEFIKKITEILKEAHEYFIITDNAIKLYMPFGEYKNDKFYQYEYSEELDDRVSSECTRVEEEGTGLAGTWTYDYSEHKYIEYSITGNNKKGTLSIIDKSTQNDQVFEDTKRDFSYFLSKGIIYTHNTTSKTYTFSYSIAGNGIVNVPYSVNGTDATLVFTKQE